MIRSIRLVNLRSLGDTGEVELRPLTMLVGANSSGKSTLLRFFPLLRQTDREESGSPLLFFGGDVDFGEFKDVIGRHGSEPVIGVGFTFEEEADEEDVKLYVEVEQDGKLGSYVRCIQLSVSGGHVVILTEANGAIRSLTVNGKMYHPLPDGVKLRVRSLIPTFLSGEGEYDDFASKLIIEHLDRYKHGRTSPERMETIAGTLCYGSEGDIIGDLANERGAGKLLENLESGGGIAPLRSLLLLRDLDVLLQECRDEIRGLARGLDYIGPFRSTPQRFYRRKELAIDRVSKEGDNIALILNALSPEERQGFSEWVRRYFGFGVRLETDGSQLVLKVEETPGTRVNLVDTGFGLSQVLPVVVQSWLGTLPRTAPGPLRPAGEHSQLFAVEQPELHLHPRHQAHLADMFVGLMRGTKGIGRHMPILVETHSEALINRLGELVADRSLAPEEISVLVFERGEDGRTQIRRSEFDAQGVLQNWPIGFFLA